MGSIASRRCRERPGGPGIAVLLALVLALGAVHAALPLHLHHGASAGLYNEEHVLAALDSVSGDIPLPAAVAGVGIDLAPTSTAPPAAGPPIAPLVRPTAPRAPPLA